MNFPQPQPAFYYTDRPPSTEPEEEEEGVFDRQLLWPTTASGYNTPTSGGVTPRTRSEYTPRATTTRAHSYALQTSSQFDPSKRAYTAPPARQVTFPVPAPSFTPSNNPAQARLAHPGPQYSAIDQTAHSRPRGFLQGSWDDFKPIKEGSTKLMASARKWFHSIGQRRPQPPVPPSPVQSIQLDPTPDSPIQQQQQPSRRPVPTPIQNPWGNPYQAVPSGSDPWRD
ncbi:hypothetical protein FRB96_005998 [Tulasnella sp. 330]|nr:hypothetical protein FRB96_005998 [Tulasnella sp. 330]KAG8882136.1 hypothetical protein FRB97_008624 [Tulasnella sp. 331]KAG8887741.1 hypothetical protein FRB98_009125 [Tulasnella sp. 332]